MADKLGIAVVGLGKYGTERILPTLKASNYCYVAGLVSGSREKLKKLSSIYDVAEYNLFDYTGFDRIAYAKDIDVVYIALPTALHAEYTIRAANAGKHVICEKPMAVSARECEEMIKACRDAGVSLYIGYRLHFEPYHNEIKRLSRDKVFGPVKHVEAKFGFDVGSGEQWRLNRKLAGGGALVDAGIYAIQAARGVFGEAPVSALVTSIHNGEGRFKEVESAISWTLSFSQGGKAYCTASYEEKMDELKVTAQTGWFGLSPAFAYEGLKGTTSSGVIQLPSIHQQAVQLDRMAESIIQGSPLVDVSGEEGLEDVKILEAIYKSAEEKREVSVRNRVRTYN